MENENLKMMKKKNKELEKLKTSEQNQVVSLSNGKQEQQHRSPGENMKLAATAAILNARIKSYDMPIYIQQHALRRVRSLLDAAPKSNNLTAIARSLKQEFDSVYGPAWHCVVGTSFGSYVTHSAGGFVYFSVDDSLSILLFKTKVKLVPDLY